MQDHITPRRVVILGGGFAGLFAARALRRSRVAVTVADRRARRLFQPLLCQCASGILSEGQIAQPLRGVLRRHLNVRCALAEATDVDADARLVRARRPGGGIVHPPYDDLSVAVGMRQSCFGRDEFAAHAPGMKTLDGALDIRRRIHRAFETAETAAKLHPGTMVTDIDAHGLTVRDHDGRTTRFGARTVWWTAGVEAPPIAAALARATGAEQDRAGRILVEPDLTLLGHPEIRVTGDVTSLSRLPGPAEVGMRSGTYAGRSVRHAVEARAKQPNPFRYVDLGSAAYTARGRAVVKAGPLCLSGFTGRRAWLFNRLAFLTGFRSRLGAVLGWSVAFATGSRRERAFTMPDTDASAALASGSKPPPPPP
ncbi:NAD(P)/FAD-dependent oxidoreductase [Streptomyces antibioticus]|uniref:NAD(P)/FAD-dependent oxidoreductase n=1 Tax=Streptomyces antibioticus TaxID=1890 RepID=UPI0033DFD410